MNEHPDVATYKRAADAFRARDLPAITETIDENVAWHVPGTSWLSAELRGRDEVMAFLRTAVERTSGTFILEDQFISGNDDHIVASQRIGATIDGDTKLFDVVSVMRFEGGRQRERWFHFSDQEGADAFFSLFG
jgi:ketosteroid isomerase-like protein